jgi:hypothetical protein
MQPFKINWQAPEFDYREKNIGWYWLSIIVAIVVLAFALWQKNFLFAVFILVGELLILTWSTRKPATIEFTLTEKGFAIGKIHFYPIGEIKSFSIESELDPDALWPDLILRFNHRLRPTLSVKVPKEQAEKIAAALKQHTPQIPFEPSFSDTFGKFLGL